MIDYTLARKLKEAGFPQKKHPLNCYDNGCYEALGEACVPTLPELIEACGTHFYSLQAYQEEIYTDYDKHEPVIYEWTAQGAKTTLKLGRGETPEIAVANLYLALHPSE